MNSAKIAILLLIFASAAFAQSSETFESAVRPFFEEHCVRCHGPEKQKGKFRVDTLKPDFLDTESAGHWIEVMDNINLGEMPPEDEPLPEIADLDVVAKWIAKELRDAQKAAQSTGGRIMIRRLSRAEYTNTVRDLFNLEFLPNEGPLDILPPDGTIDGFDKVSRALLLDPSLLETYFTVAQTVVDKAIELGEPPVPTWRSRMEYEEIDAGIGYIKKDRSVEVRDDGLVSMSKGMRSDENLYHPWNDTLIPEHGNYTVRIRMGADRGERGEPVFVSVKRRGDGELFYQEVDAPIDAPKVYEFTRPFEATGGGELGVDFVNGTSFSRVDYYGSDFTKQIRALSTSGKATEAGKIRARAIAEGHFSSRPEPNTLYTKGLPRIFFDWIEVEGPLYDEWPPKSTRTIFPDGLTDANRNLNHAREVFAQILPRAFRRPVEKREIDRLTGIVATGIEAGDTFVESMKSGLVAMLCSPSFLYLFEPGVTDQPATERL